MVTPRHQAPDNRNNPMYIAHEIISQNHPGSGTSMNWETGRHERNIDTPMFNYGDTLMNYLLGDGRYPLKSLVDSARVIIEKATGKCAELLGANALAKFDRISKNIQYNDNLLPSSSAARTTGQYVDLNPRSWVWNSDYRSPLSEDKKLSKVQLDYHKRYNKGLKDYNEVLKDLNVNEYEYALAGIIHEFLHTTCKFDDDVVDGDSGQSRRNQKSVIEKCFSKEQKK
jgi:hypothetical protein